MSQDAGVVAVAGILKSNSGMVGFNRCLRPGASDATLLE